MIFLGSLKEDSAHIFVRARCTCDSRQDKIRSETGRTKIKRNSWKTLHCTGP